MNTLNMAVTAEMTRDDVANEIRSKVKEIKDNEMKLLDGYYRAHDCWFSYFDVSDDGDTVKCKDTYDMYDYDEFAEYGDFGKCLVKFHFKMFPFCQVRLVKRWQKLLAESVDTTSSFVSNSQLETWMKMES